METLFAMPESQHNNDVEDSGMVRISQFIPNVSTVGGIHLRQRIVSITGSVLITVEWFNDGVLLSAHGEIHRLPEFYEIMVNRDDIIVATDVRIVIETIGRARYWGRALASYQGEDIEEWRIL